MRAVGELKPVDEGERDAQAVLTELLGIEWEIYGAGLVESSLSVLGSPAQELRKVFD